MVKTYMHFSPVTEYECQFRNRSDEAFRKIFAFSGRHLGGIHMMDGHIATVKDSRVHS